MPRLPTELDLGERPPPQPSGAVGNLPDAGADGAALAHMGRTIEHITDRLQHARRASQLADALGNATEELGTKADGYRRDQDFTTAPARFKQDATVIGQQHAQGITDPVVRDLFVSQYHKYAVAKQLGVVQAAAKQESDYNVSRLDATEDVMAHAYANATNPVEQMAVAGQFQMAVGEMKAAGWITDVNAEQRMKRFATKADQAEALRDINSDPVAAGSKLADPSMYPRLDGVMRQQLVHTAEVRERQLEAGQKNLEIRAEKDAREELFQKFAKGQLRATDVAQSPASTIAKEHYLNLLKAQAKEALERPIKQEPSAFLGVLEKIRDGTIVNETQIEGEYAKSVERGRGITWEQAVQLRKELTDARTPDGERLSKVKGDFLQGVAAQIDKSNPMMGRIDPSGKQKVFEFSREVDRRIEDYRKAGKNPHDLFDPSKPDYMGKPDALKPYQKSMQESMQDFSSKVRGNTPTAGKPARNPGESIDQWKQRVGAK